MLLEMAELMGQEYGETNRGAGRILFGGPDDVLVLLGRHPMANLLRDHGVAALDRPEQAVELKRIAAPGEKGRTPLRIEPHEQPAIRDPHRLKNPGDMGLQDWRGFGLDGIHTLIIPP
jgi:hypothetical protein